MAQWTADFPVDTEQIRIKSNRVQIRLNVISGVDDGFHVCVSPTANISGYGDDKDSARSSFEHNAQLFMQDLLSLSTKERNNFLKSLGWKQMKHESKNYSTPFVDKDGILNNLEESSIDVLEVA
jgi:hypothetical protein